MMKFRNLFLAFLLVGLGGLVGCQSFRGAVTKGENIATVINQTSYSIEVQRQGNYVATLGRGETYHLQASAEAEGNAGAVTVVVLAYEDDGGYAGTAHRVFRPRNFAVWEVTSSILSRPEGSDPVE